MRFVRKVKEMKRCSEKEWVLLWMKRGGKAVVEDKTRCNNTPVARARERERERHTHTHTVVYHLGCSHRRRLPQF
jgi:hypothetical protein